MHIIEMNTMYTSQIQPKGSFSMGRWMQTRWSEGKEKQTGKVDKKKKQQESKVNVITTTTSEIRKEKNQLSLF